MRVIRRQSIVIVCDRNTFDYHTITFVACRTSMIARAFDACAFALRASYNAMTRFDV